VFPGHAACRSSWAAPRSVAAVTAAGHRGRARCSWSPSAEPMSVNPALEDLYDCSARSARSTQALNLPDGNTKILVEGKRRARVTRRLSDNERPLRRGGGAREPTESGGPGVDALARTVKGRRALREAQPRGPARHADLRQRILEDPDQARRHAGGRAQAHARGAQELLETVDDRQAPGAGVQGAADRDRVPAGREEAARRGSCASARTASGRCGSTSR
jgi:ATP-dependent Lon protease